MSNGWVSVGSFQVDTSEPRTQEADDCADFHDHGCPCQLGGDVILPPIVIEDHGGYVVTVDREVA